MSSPDEPGLLSPVSAGTTAESTTSDRSVLAAAVDVELALVGALADLGIAPLDAPGAVRRACDPVGSEAAEIARQAAADGNPVIPLVRRVRRRLEADAPELAQWWHLGLTSQDVMDSALMLVASRVLAGVAGDLTAAGGRCAGLARQHRATAMVGRTLTQHAMPLPFGVVAARWLVGLADALETVDGVRGQLPVQVGGPVGVPTAYGDHAAEVAHAVAERLGLQAPVLSWHTRRTPVLRVGHALVETSAAAGTIAADVLTHARTEVGELAEGRAGGSSSMPHKQNPVLATLIASAARQVPSYVGVLNGSGAAEDERPAGAWHAEWEPFRLALRTTAGASSRLSTLLSTVEVRVDVMAGHLADLVRSAGLADTAVEEAVTCAGPWIDRAIARWESTA